MLLKEMILEAGNLTEAIHHQTLYTIYKVIMMMHFRMEARYFYVEKSYKRTVEKNIQSKMLWNIREDVNWSERMFVQNSQNANVEFCCSVIKL